MLGLDPKLTMLLESIAESNKRTADALEHIATAIVAPGDIEVTARVDGAKKPAGKKG